MPERTMSSGGGGGGSSGYHGSRRPYWGGYYYLGGCYYYFDGSYYSPELDRFSSYRNRWTSDVGEEPTTSRDTFFFPPVPPPLGVPPPPKSPFGERFTPPTELASYVNEPFYTPLGSRLVTRDLSKKLLQRLDAYRATRASLLEELRSQIALIKGSTTEEAQRSLESLSERQTPRIQELETQAEAFRSELLRNGLVSLFWGSGDWNESRSWKLGTGNLEGDRDSTLAYEFKVMRAAVFFQEGLSPAQRRLLREVAMDLQVEAFRPRGRDASPDVSLVYFQPETSRIHFSTTLPPDVAAKLAVFQKQKNDLKSQLRDALYDLDSAPAPRRAQALRKLAEQQEGPLGAIEVLAEDIRHSLVAHPNLVGPPAAPPFPAELATRIAAYQKWKLSLQKVLQTKIEETRNALGPTVVARQGFNANGQNRVVIDASGVSANYDTIRAAREAVAAFNRDYADKFSGLNREQEQIRSEIAAWANANTSAVDRKSVDDLLKDFEQSRKRQESWQLYEDYQNATLLPGLSPEQRRLLYEGALEKLSLPLPPGENLAY